MSTAFETLLEIDLEQNLLGPTTAGQCPAYNTRLEGRLTPATLSLRFQEINSTAAQFPSRKKLYAISSVVMGIVPVAFTLASVFRDDTEPTRKNTVFTALMLAVLTVGVLLTLARATFNRKQRAAVSGMLDVLTTFNQMDAHAAGVFWNLEERSRSSFLMTRHPEANLDFAVHLQIPAQNVIQVFHPVSRDGRTVSAVISISGRQTQRRQDAVPAYNVSDSQESVEQLPPYEAEDKVAQVPRI
ncbi:hypothetical protein HDU78_002232 [Chytriomyces hyalinus]|nr:hypothetical protein HDU78_002232 [Chytriomyces hyalinus]KAJ3244505.1 hypothetical protein HDU77_009844 [Chytriomyces hyalinus]